MSSRLSRKILICVAFILALVWYANTHFYRDPGSIFFDESRAYEQRYSIVRSEQVRQYVESYEPGGERHEHVGKAGGNATLCLAVNSVKRKHGEYLETTVASILAGLTPQERSDLHLSVFVAELDPIVHPSWSSAWLGRAVDSLYTYNLTRPERGYLRNLTGSAAGYKQKGVFDYMYALRRCLDDTDAPYIATFEDDIMLADGWLVRTLFGLRDIGGDPTDRWGEWLFVRLFNQERSTGWYNQNIGGNFEPWIILGIAFGITLLSVLFRRCSRRARTVLDPSTLFVVVCILNPALVILFYQCGKASLLPPSPGVFEEPFGCCSQAVVFPRGQIAGLISFLDERLDSHLPGKEKGQIDLLLKKRARDEDLKRYALYPVQGQHIGLDSARMTNASEARAIWSMAYEDLNQATVERQHAEMVAEYYGL